MLFLEGMRLESFPKLVLNQLLIWFPLVDLMLSLDLNFEDLGNQGLKHWKLIKDVYDIYIKVSSKFKTRWRSRIIYNHYNIYLKVSFKCKSSWFGCWLLHELDDLRLLPPLLLPSVITIGGCRRFELENLLLLWLFWVKVALGLGDGKYSNVGGDSDGWLDNPKFKETNNCKLF